MLWYLQKNSEYKSRLASEIIVEWPNGFIASAVIIGGSYIDIGVKRPKDISNLTYRGLIGNLNSNPVDDLMTISGEQLTPPLDYEMLYSKFGNGWKIKENNRKSKKITENHRKSKENQRKSKKIKENQRKSKKIKKNKRKSKKTLIPDPARYPKPQSAIHNPLS